MSEFDLLINTICNPVTSIENRSNAERRLLEVLSDVQTWSQHLPSLYSANDTICFFIGIGYQRLVWRHWFRLTPDGKEALTNTITSILMTRSKMSSFAKAKLEQVLAAICVNSMTLQPVLNLLVDCNQPGAYNGLSAMRTVMDTVLSEDPKIDPNSRQMLESASESVIVPLTNLACNACMNALQSYNEENSGLMIVSLELMKTIVAKLPIGPHITVDVLNLMFTIAELGADQQSVFHQSALSSMEILTEIMQKKYIPRDDNNNSNNSNNSNNNKLTGDRSLRMMMHIVNKTIELLQSYREHGSIDDSAIVLSLLDFISVFSESHLERCLQYSHFGSNNNGNNTNNLISPSNSNGLGMTEESQSLTQNITTFFNELVSITTVSMDPKVLIKIVSVWNRILTIEGVKNIILGQSNVCVPIIAHLLQASLLQSNKNLQENLDDLIEDLKLDIVVDPHIKEILTKISTISASSSSPDSALNSAGVKGSGESHQSNLKSPSHAIPRPSPSSSQEDKDFSHGKRGGDDLYGVEEFNYIGSTLLTDVTDLFAELVLSPDAKGWLQSTVNNLLVQNINLLSANFQSASSNSPATSQAPSSSGQSKASKAQIKYYALDLCFLIRVLPMVSDNKAELVLQMINFLLQVIENNKTVTNAFQKSISKEMVVLPLNCCQIVGQILQSCLSGVSFSSTFTPSLVQWCKILEPMITLLAQGMIEYVTYHPNYSMHSSHEIIFQGIAILLTQTINLYAEFFDEKVQILYYSLMNNPPNSPSGDLSGIPPPIPANNSILVLKRQLEEMFQNIITHPDTVSLEVYALIVCSQDVLNSQSVAPMLLNQLVEASGMLENTLNNNNFNSIGNILDIITRITGSMDVLTRNHSISKAIRRQTLVQNFSPLQNIMIQLESLLLQINLQCWKYVVISRYGLNYSFPFTMTWPLDKIHQSSRLSTALMCSLCQCLGKKTFGKTASDTFEVSVAFIETCTSTQTNANSAADLLPMLPYSSIANDVNARRIHSINPNNAIVLLLFDTAGLRFLLQVLELSRILAESTAASSQNVTNQIQSTYRLIVAILPYLSDERVCAELLQSTLKAGIMAIKCYWQRSQKTFALSMNSPTSPSGPVNPFSQIVSKQMSGGTDDSVNGQNVKPLVELLVQLCIGSLGQNIPPQDTHLALEGMISLRNQHNLFRVMWFHESLWLGLFLPCLRAIVLRMHDSNFHQLEELFIELCNAKIDYIENSQKNATSSENNNNTNNANNSNGNNSQSKKVLVLQEFWYFVGQEMIKISGEYQCSERVHELMSETMTNYNWMTNGDSATCIRLVIFPIAAEISRRIQEKHYYHYHIALFL